MRSNDQIDSCEPGTPISVSVLGVESPFHVKRTGHAQFWARLSSGLWEPETVELLTRLLGPGDRMVDVGAWIGPTTLVAASLGAEVVAFEPDPSALAELRGNLRLNPSVEALVRVVPIALSTEDNLALLSADRLGDSMASLVRGGPESVEVETIDARKWSTTRDFMEADVLKMDVEGAEYALVWRMRSAFARNRPVFLLSVHAYPFREKFLGWPRWIEKPLARLLSSSNRLRLLIATRRYGHRWLWNSSDSIWRLLKISNSARFLLSLSNTELIFADDLIIE